ncbi:MAG: hypothetical protein KJO53_15745 [Eudoraea sp.]|nr:hypothetical protein [Eudoraea sp.]MBT8293308.1 hypothetical protein [Eudoraea sp.]
MNKLLILCGLVMLGTTATPQETKLTSNCTLTEDSIYESTVDVNNLETLAMQSETVWKAPKLVSRMLVHTPDDIKVSEIVFIEEETSIDLGFDTADYLPEGFDPYNVYFDINSVEFIDDEEEMLGFDTAAYLPEGFNAYANPGSLEGINYIEEEVIDLGFDTAKYIPEDFNPYEFYFDLDSVEYIEDEDELEFDYSTGDYLPVGSDPLSK